MDDSTVARPTTGEGRIAGFGPRLLAFIIDAILADILAVIVNGGYHATPRQNWVSYLAFLVIEVVFVSLAGQTPGMRVVNIAVVREDGRGRVGVQWVLLRTVLLAVIIPAVIPDKTGRWMHDRAAGSITLHTR